MAERHRPEPLRGSLNAPARSLPAVPPSAGSTSTDDDQSTLPPPTPAANTSRPPQPPQDASKQDQSGTRTSALHKTVHSVQQNIGDPNSPELTPLRAHYLKKTLVGLAVERELNALCDPTMGASALGLLGPPFQPLSQEGKVVKINRTEGGQGDLPLLRYLFHQFLLPFPFLAAAPPTFWSGKVQPFVTSFLAINQTRLSPTAFSTSAGGEPDLSLASEEELAEYHARRKVWEKLQKNLAMLFGAGVKLTSAEEVVRIGQGDLRRLEEMAEERRRKVLEREKRLGVTFQVNVICVRTVTEKGRVRSKSHDEFVIQTRRANTPDVHVSRRYGDFKRLADELRHQFPEAALPILPPKDRTAMTTPVAQPSSNYYSTYNPLRAFYYGANALAGPSSGTATPTSAASADSDLQRSESVDQYASSPLAREKNRLTLRAYLTAVLNNPWALNSNVLRSFLLSAPTQLTLAEQMDAQRRADADAVREEGKRRFKVEAEKRVEALREGLAEFKGDVLGKEGGLRGVFDVVRRVENVKDLPKAEKSVLEWGKISMAASIFQLFVASDTASDTLNQLKRVHGMMPYFMLKGVLKISNPMAMIRGVLDLFLARPFGGQSLLQRMFSTSLMEEVRAVQDDIDAVSERIDSPIMCQKVDQYVNAPFEIQTMFRRDAADEGLDLITVLLRSPEAPSLDRASMQRVVRGNKAYGAYKAYQKTLDDSDDDEGPDNDDAWLFEDLTVLMKLMVRKKEKEQLLALIFEGTTAELLKDIITIFYAPLALVYKAANIADSIGDAQNFLNDLIRTVEAVEEASQEDPGRTVQTFIDLVQRHEQAFYSFVHKVHAKGEGLFDSLMSWIELFLDFARDGLRHQVDLENLLPHAGEERMSILREVDTIAAYHYKMKVAYEQKVRRRFAGQDNNADEAALIEGMVASLNLGDTVVADVAENEEEDDTSEEDDESEVEDERAAALNTGVEPDQWDSHEHKSKHKKRLSIGSQAEVDEDGSPKLQAEDSKLKRLSNSVSLHRHKAPAQSPTPPPQDEPRARSAKPQTPVTPGRRKKRNKKSAAELIPPPELHHLPALAPVMVELIRPLLTIRAIQQPRTMLPK